MCKLKPSEFGAVMSAAVVSMTMATRTHAPQSSRFALGQKPTQNQIAALNVTVFPDGTGLPFGHGNAIEDAASTLPVARPATVPQERVRLITRNSLADTAR